LKKTGGRAGAGSQQNGPVGHAITGRYARHSGIEFEAPLAYVWAFRGGKIIHFQSFRKPAEALEAAGRSE
jgi:ketosteroid isomerase-like protein